MRRRSARRRYGTNGSPEDAPQRFDLFYLNQFAVGPTAQLQVLPRREPSQTAAQEGTSGSDFGWVAKMLGRHVSAINPILRA